MLAGMPWRSSNAPRRRSKKRRTAFAGRGGCDGHPGAGEMGTRRSPARGFTRQVEPPAAAGNRSPCSPCFRTLDKLMQRRKRSSIIAWRGCAGIRRPSRKTSSAWPPHWAKNGPRCPHALFRVRDRCRRTSEGGAPSGASGQYRAHGESLDALRARRLHAATGRGSSTSSAAGLSTKRPPAWKPPANEQRLRQRCSKWKASGPAARRRERRRGRSAARRAHDRDSGGTGAAGGAIEAADRESASCTPM